MEVISITEESDIVLARRLARNQADALGFSTVNKTRIATAVSELARNVYVHGGGGEMHIELLEDDGRSGIRCIFLDQGPGIEDIERATGEGFSTGGTLGHGLPGSRRLMDDLQITSAPGQGTRVEVTKWTRR